MKKRVLSLMLAAAMIFSLAACGKKAEETPAASEPASTEAPSTEAAASGEPVEIQVFIAASLNKVMTELAEMYNKDHPEVTINYNADSSGTLLTQIQEGAACDMFFSAAQKQMNALEEDKLIVDGTRVNVVNNQVCVVKAKGTETAVTGLADIEKAKSIALADGSVPVGKYTRQALVKIGKLPETEDVSAITTAEVMEALGGVEISEQSNVSKVRTAVMEGSCEVGTVYYSDTYTFEDQIEIIEKVSYDLTGNVIYPLCRVVNKETTDAQNAAADAFYQFLLSDEATAVFDKYLFDTNVER